jgi:hypothetical protein
VARRDDEVAEGAASTTEEPFAIIELPRHELL